MGLILTTGGAGFIGSNFIRHRLQNFEDSILNLDKLTYAGHQENLKDVENEKRYAFLKGSIGDRALLDQTLRQCRPKMVVNFAAESHVDRSISGPQAFVQTNVVDTFQLLESVKQYWETLPISEKEKFRFLHISTDEVYGSLQLTDPAFTEEHQYAPNSPYSASKAASDHFVRAYYHTYGVPVLTTNCSNNYGPFQFPEKLIPLTILNAMRGLPIPIYGEGKNIRDWLYVEDHCSALCAVLDRGVPGEVYNVGGHSEFTNLEIVNELCSILDGSISSPLAFPHSRLIEFVKDRKGHDWRYAINTKKIEKELGWAPKESLRSGLRKTVEWYLSQKSWVETVTGRSYQAWITENYEGRL